MQSFGTEEYGNKEGFTIKCIKCGRGDAILVPTHYYDGR